MGEQPIPDEELASLRRLHEQATPAPWTTEVAGPRDVRVLNVANGVGDRPVAWCGANQANPGRDAEFIAAARNALPGLLERLRLLEEAVERVLADKAPMRMEHWRDGPWTECVACGETWHEPVNERHAIGCWFYALRAARAAAKGEGG